MRGMRVEWPLVGRSAEIGAIRAALEAQPHRGTVLTGPAGQGKTRLGHEALRLASAAGMRPLVAVATRAASSISLGALAHFLPPPDRRPDRLADLVARAESAIAAQAGPNGVALLVDDAHLVDDATATVVHQLALTGAAAVIATVRDDEDVPDAIRALWKDDLAERLEIGPLTPVDVDQLAAEVVGGPLTAAASGELWRASLGNPLFVRELVLGALEAGYLHEQAGNWRFTSRLRSSSRLVELIGARLAQTRPEERETLELLSVAGELALDLVTQLATSDVLATLESKRLIVVERRDADTVVRLAHPVYGEVLRDTIGEIRTMAVNRALADTVDGMTEPPMPDVLRAAVWRLDGGGAVHPELMAEAARTAYIAHDEALALRLAAAARAAGAGIEATLVEARALKSTGRAGEAEALLIADANRATTPDHRALVAIERAAALFFVLGRGDEANQVLDDALAECDVPEWRDEMIAQRAEFDMLAGRPLEAIDRCEPILGLDAGRAFVVAAGAAGPALAVVGRGLDADALGVRALAARIALGPQDALADPGLPDVVRGLGLGEAGQFAAAEAIVVATHHDAIVHADSPRQAWAALVAGRILLIQGRIAAAGKWFDQSEALFSELHLPGPRRWALAGRVIAAAMAADSAATVSAAHALDAVAADTMLFMESEVDRAQAWRHVIEHDRARAVELLLIAADRAEASGSRALAAGALHDAARLGSARGVLDRLERVAEGCQGDLVATRVAYTRAAAANDGAALDAVASRFEAMEAWLFAGESAATAAAAHWRSGEARLARASARRSYALRARCEGAATPALAAGGAAAPLTPRERDIAGLAAAGATNREIADGLELSVRTVENHLQRAYEKLGVTNRAELTKALADEG